MQFMLVLDLWFVILTQANLVELFWLKHKLLLVNVEVLHDFSHPFTNNIIEAAG